MRPLFDDGATAAQAATRDYVLKIDAENGGPALLNVFGGKLTTYRRLAQSALAQLAPHLPTPARPGTWTARATLPGGDFPVQGFEARVKSLSARYPALAPQLIRRLARAYGVLAPHILGAAKTPADLGRCFGAGLTEAEIKYLMNREWAMTAQDVAWRRSKLGLALSPAEVAVIDGYMKAQAPALVGGLAS